MYIDRGFEMKNNMKKIVLFFVIFIVLTVSVFYIKSYEVFEEIETIGKNITTNSKIKEKDDDYFQEGNVRIVIINDLKNTIYRQTINISGKEVKMYYGKKYENIETNNNFELKCDSKVFKNKSIVKFSGTKKLYINDISNGYNGSFFVYKTDSGLVVVNEVEMKDYVAAVISSEMSENFPLEALKAQAICARTYISKSNPEIYKKYNADGDDTTSFQVYNKIEPGDNCKKAAKDTNNQVMKCNDELINAYYFSTSCGFTTDYHIWGKNKLKYLAGSCLINDKKYSQMKDEDLCEENQFRKFINEKPNCYEEEYPFFRWNTYLSSEQIKNGVWNQVEEDIGKLKNVQIVQRGKGGIVSQLLIKGSNKEVLLTNQNQIRRVLTSIYSEINLNDGNKRTGMELLPSAFFDIKEVYKKGKLQGIKINGGGFGHGSGMSQNAAKEMALEGKKYSEILVSFYSNIEITNLQ